MLHQQLSKNLKEGETLVRLVRRDLLASAGSLVGSGGMILLDFFLLTWWLKHGYWGLLGFGLLFGSGALFGLRALVEWRLNAFLLTNQRVIQVWQRGFFTRSVSATTYEQVTDVRFNVKGPVQTIFGLGAVEVQTAGEGENLRLAGVRHPAQLQAFITDVLHATRQDRGKSLTAVELVSALTKMKKDLGPQKFNELLSRVEPAARGKVDNSDERSRHRH
ncbi:MAG: PH domain-containing protein [Candidatus Kerfeldbacteria bacterium]|nr:PH domain-containing protein [Candidatus Kerfeldbacteria bacterium]